ncbi:MAG: mandelate racemase/muconate lactonizing enzyme family protein [Anaerolineae bacterium]|nr:mandelate racemase/muconate lactonizing enzyme family protein [Anaerolineae bacterium]
MRITSVRVFEVEGGERSGLALYEIERGGLAPGQATPYRATFTEIETDEGLTGLTLGGSAASKALGQELVGEDPLRVEYLWNKLYTGTYLRLHRIRDMSALDLALWDLIGKAKGEPVHRLLGGPCQERIPAYAAMLGFSTDPEDAARASLEWVGKGFQGLKWYLPHNALAGQEGLRHSVALIGAVREAVGPEVDIMVDCLLSGPTDNSLLYAIKLARALEPYHPTWIEEPLSFDDLDAHVKLAQATRIPLAFGEHWYTRWQIKAILDSGAGTVLQPDPGCAGGITEMRKIMTLASTYGVPVIPHANETCRHAAHLLFAHPARVCPAGEWGIRINHNAQHFYTDFYEPVGGYFYPPQGPGFGYALDEARIERRREL